MPDFFDTQDRSKRLAFYLDEGTFTKTEIVSAKGSDIGYVSASEIKRGDAVKFKSGTARTVVKASDNEFIGVVLADPRGVPPTASGMPKRQATIVFIEPTEIYHLKLSDTNTAVSVGDYIVWEGTCFNKSSTAPTKGVIFKALDEAAANSGKYIDVYCVSVNKQEYTTQ